MLQEGMIWVDGELQKTWEEVIFEQALKDKFVLFDGDRRGSLIQGWGDRTNHPLHEYFSIFPGEGNFSEPRTPSQTQNYKALEFGNIAKYIYSLLLQLRIWNLATYLYTCDLSLQHTFINTKIWSLCKSLSPSSRHLKLGGRNTAGNGSIVYLHEARVALAPAPWKGIL